MNIKYRTAAAGICCYTTLWNINVSKQATDDKLQGSVATYLMCGGVVNNQSKVYCWACEWKKNKIGEYLAKCTR